MPDRLLPRRRFLAWLGASAALPAVAAWGGGAAEAKSFPVPYSEAAWRKRLTPEQFEVLREEATERPYTSPLLKEKRKGTYICAADGNQLFASETKFESGTGWPSFYRPLPRGIGTSTDFKLGYPR